MPIERSAQIVGTVLAQLRQIELHGDALPIGRINLYRGPVGLYLSGIKLLPNDGATQGRAALFADHIGRLAMHVSRRNRIIALRESNLEIPPKVARAEGNTACCTGAFFRRFRLGRTVRSGKLGLCPELNGVAPRAVVDRRLLRAITG